MLRLGELDQAKAFPHPDRDLLGWEPLPGEPQREVVVHREGIEQRRELEDESDPGPQLHQVFVVQVADRLAVDQHPSGVGLQQSDDVLQGDAFPGTRESHQDRRLALGDGEREAVEDGSLAEGFMDVLEFDHEADATPERRKDAT